MKVDDHANYHSWTTSTTVGATTYITYTDIWNYGKEVWCNLEGRYMHIVADLAQYAG